MNKTQQLVKDGFAVTKDVFSDDEIASILAAIESIDTSKPAFRKRADLFAIRRFLHEVPAAVPILFTERFQSCLHDFFGRDYFLVKSIYFDKPAQSNWFVPYHQDLTVSVDRKANVDGFGPWTVKQNQFAVQPPLPVLEANFTVRIHLDDADENNGALWVIPGSHTKGVYRPEHIDWSVETEAVCPVPRGGVMIMRPLLLHASSRTTNHKRRRVIHLEFSNQQLPPPLQWSERLNALPVGDAVAK